MSTEGTGIRSQTGHSDNGQKCAYLTVSSANGSSSICGRQFACPHCQRSCVTKCGLKQHVDRRIEFTRNNTDIVVKLVENASWVVLITMIMLRLIPGSSDTHVRYAR